jgi:hypothetical protein
MQQSDNTIYRIILLQARVMSAYLRKPKKHPHLHEGASVDDVLSIKDNGLYPQSEEMLRSVILKLCRAPKLPHMKNATLIHEVQPR